MEKQLETDKVTRLEVIGPAGRELVRHGVSLKLDLQDEGTTLKIFLEEAEAGVSPSKPYCDMCGSTLQLIMVGDVQSWPCPVCPNTKEHDG